MKQAPSIETARGELTALVRRLLVGEVQSTGRVKSAIFNISRMTGISAAWLKRANEAQPSFTPHLHFYFRLCDALERQIERQEKLLAAQKLQLEATRNARTKTLREARKNSSEPRCSLLASALREFPK